MLTNEDVDSWNKLFPDCQLNETNLSNPNQQFLTLALVVYLRRFGYQVEPPFNLYSENNENNREKRLFLIKLVQQIDNFFKITDKSYTFTYYDLIRPTPKKTAHMLYILLNYFYYYNLYKENVFKMAGDKIRKLEELKGLIDDTRRANENCIEEGKNLKPVVENLENEVPAERTKLNDLVKTLNEQEEKLEKLKQSYRELEEKLQHLERQKKLLLKRIVPNDEARELQNQLQMLKSDLAKLKEKELNNVANLNECKESNSKYVNLSKEIEKTYEIIPIRLIEQLKETGNLLTKFKKEENDLMLKYESVLHEIAEENETLHSLENEQQNKKQEYDNKEKQYMKSFTEKQKLIEQKSKEILQLEDEYRATECKIEEQRDITQYLEDIISKILALYQK